MKKLILTCALFASLITAAFAENNFAHRFFEVKLDVPVSVSNNLIAVADIFQEKVVIDLPKIADQMGKGASLNADFAPSLTIGLDIPKGLILGIKVGAEASMGVGINKDIFEFIGKGNVGKEELTARLDNTYADLFAFAAVNGGWNGKKLRLNVTGSAFWALAHLEASETQATIYSNDDAMGIKAQLDAKLYTPVDVSGDDAFSDIQGIINNTKGNIGFDVSADAKYDLFRFLSVGAKTRIPVVPSRLTMLSSVNYKFEQEINIMDMIGSSMEGENGEGSESGSGSSGSESTESTEQGQGEETPLISQAVSLASPYSIHRPLKLGVSADFHPFGTLLSANGYIGIGIRHPFSQGMNKALKAVQGKLDDPDVYVDYEIGGKLSLWNIITVRASHSYYDEIFKNEVVLALNIRLAEVDAGVSLQSANFAKSFSGAGLGAFVTVCLGF